jgi:hypothetical protein
MKQFKPYYDIPEKPELTPSIYEVIYELGDLVEKEKGTSSGITALYWNLIRTVQNHVKSENK